MSAHAYALVKISLNKRPLGLWELTHVCIYFGKVKNGRGYLSLVSNLVPRARSIYRPTSKKSNLDELRYALFFLRQGWYTTAVFTDRVWTVHHQPADHWRALQLHLVLQQLSLASELVTCQLCIEHEFDPPQCSQQNHTGGSCVALLAGHKGIYSETILSFLLFVFFSLDIAPAVSLDLSALSSELEF